MDYSRRKSGIIPYAPRKLHKRGVRLPLGGAGGKARDRRHFRSTAPDSHCLCDRWPKAIYTHRQETEACCSESTTTRPQLAGKSENCIRRGPLRGGLEEAGVAAC